MVIQPAEGSLAEPSSDVRTALVLASTAGLGLACARSLAAENMRVAISGRRRDVAVQLAAELPGAMGIFLDLTDEAAIDRAIDQVDREFGQIDCVVLNSGGPPPGRASELNPRELAAAMEGILYPAQNVIRRVLPGMLERRWGRIVAIGSSGVEQPIAGLAASNVARAALAALLKTLAGEVGREGVTVNMVIPGRFATHRVQTLDQTRAIEQGISLDDVRQRSSAAIPLGRYGDPSELAALVAFLCSPRASYITGSLLRADGGLVGCIG